MKIALLIISALLAVCAIMLFVLAAPFLAISTAAASVLVFFIGVRNPTRNLWSWALAGAVALVIVSLLIPRIEP